MIANLIWSVIVIAWIAQSVYYRFFAESSVSECDAYDAYDDTQTLFVHEAGFIGGGYTQIENIVPTFLEYGDLVAVRYEGKQGNDASKFDAEAVARRTAWFISEEIEQHGYQNLVFFGSSMGGKLSFMTSQVLVREYGIDPAMIKVILVDSPLTSKDLTPFFKGAIPFLAALPYIPVLGTLVSIPGLRKLFMFALVLPPNKKLVAQLLPEERRAFLNSVKGARKVKPFFASGQAATIIKPIRAKYPSPWLDGNVVFLRSQKDELTSPSAYGSWEHFLGYEPLDMYAEGAGHCEYGIQPDAYREVLPKAFNYLGIYK